jgi:hypothetical protein
MFNLFFLKYFRELNGGEPHQTHQKASMTLIPKPDDRTEKRNSRDIKSPTKC